MKCEYTAFDRIIYSVKELPKNKLKEGVEIVQEFSLQDIIDFGAENNCYTELQGNTIFDFIIKFEDLDGNYWEEDEKNYKIFLDAIGITDEIFKKYAQ